MLSSDDGDCDIVLEENYIDYGITNMNELNIKSKTTSLSLHYNSIIHINGLQSLTFLRHLDLSSNLICKIQGLNSLINLRTLNLSSNKIKKVEGLNGLIQLVKLNVSYNEINDISGIAELPQIDNHPLSSLIIHGNQIRLLNHITRTLNKLKNLRELVLLENTIGNPICNNLDYRKKILNALPQIRVLDGKDRNGNPLEINILSDIPGLDGFMDFLSSSTEPQIIESKMKSPIKDQSNNNKYYSIESEVQTFKEKDDSELKLKLVELEEKLNNFVKLKQDDSQNSMVKDLKEQPTKEQKHSSKSQLKVSKLLEELDYEKTRRINSENKLHILMTKYKELQLSTVNDRKAKEDTIKATEKLTKAFTEEKSKKEDLERMLCELKDHIQHQESQFNEEKSKLELNLKDFKMKLNLKDKELLSKQNIIDQEHHSLEENQLRQQTAESNLVNMKKQCSNLEEKIEELQKTMSKRERDYQDNLSNRYSLESKELKNYVNTQINYVKENCSKEIKLYEDRLKDSTKSYKDLENEFRLALHMEAEKFAKLEKSYQDITKDNLNLVGKYDMLFKRESDNKSLIQELTGVVKEQKTKLVELSRNKQELHRESKERILILEAHLEEARKQMLQFEMTKQDNKRIQAKLSAHESVIEGLKAERKLWSEELAQQGYLLTQDRSKLECKIDSQSSEIQTLKLQINEQAEQIKEKCKLIEEQTEVIIKLKQGLSNKDAETKDYIDKLLKDQKQMETEINDNKREHQDLLQLNDRLTKRKEQLKDMIVQLQEKLEESQATQELVNKKWKEKSELIAKLESQVVQMKDYWERKCQDLEEEREDAIDKFNVLQQDFNSIQDQHKYQLDIIVKERDFIRHEAHEKVQQIEEEMRRLLMETDQEKQRLKSRMKILNKAICDLEKTESK